MAPWVAFMPRHASSAVVILGWVMTAMLVWGADTPGGGLRLRTSLANPSVRFTVPDRPYVILRRGPLEAVVVDNRAVDDPILPGHRAGYHGLGALKHDHQARNLFVPAYAGLNFEHIHDGTVKPREVLFEPRQAPMQLRVIDAATAELYQAPTPYWGLESCQRYQLTDDGLIEMTFECIPRRAAFTNGYIGLFWASYIDQPESLDIHFRGRLSDDAGLPPGWVRGVSPAHGARATHLAPEDQREFQHDPDFPLTLVFNRSRYRYHEPWYFGLCRGMAFAQIFRSADAVRWSQSPSGGGSGNPAWDFQWFLPDYRVGRCYQLVMRALYRPAHQGGDETATREAMRVAVRPVLDFGAGGPDRSPADLLASAFEPPPEFTGQLGTYRSPLLFDEGSPVQSAADWPRRRGQILHQWHELMGPWPPLLASPRCDVVSETRREDFRQQRVRVEIAPNQTGEGWLLVPNGAGAFPAVLVVYYEPETCIGLGSQPLRDFGLQLARRGFVTLSIGTPGGDARAPDLGGAQCQPLSFHAYVAANCWRILAERPEVDPARIGIVGHSYGGKWALFAAALWDKFACVAVSDPGIVFDEARPNVNYWEPWYLGLDPACPRAKPGPPAADNPRTGAYRRMIETGRDLHELHALIAPRAFLVSGGAEDPPQRWVALNHAVAVNRLLGYPRRVGMTQREGHTPTEASNQQLYQFFERYLRGPASGP